MPGAEQNSGSPDADPVKTIDRQHFAAQFRAVYPTMWRIAAGMIGDRSHAEDIVQEAAIIALDKLDTFAAGSNFAAWMAAIVRRCSLNYARKMRNRATVATDPVMLDQAEFTTQARIAPAQVVSDAGILHETQTEFDDEVLRGLNSLSDEARCCLLLRIVQQLSYAEISDLMQIAAGTAMSHVHRAKNVLRQHMQRPYPPDSGASKNHDRSR